MDLGPCERVLKPFLGRQVSSQCGCEFCEVVCGANHGLFGFDLVDVVAQEELAEAFRMLDLAGDGLDDLFSPSIPASMACAREFCAHFGDERAP